MVGDPIAVDCLKAVAVARVIADSWDTLPSRQRNMLIIVVLKIERILAIFSNLLGTYKSCDLMLI